MNQMFWDNTNQTLNSAFDFQQKEVSFVSASNYFKSRLSLINLIFSAQAVFLRNSEHVVIFHQHIVNHSPCRM